MVKRLVNGIRGIWKKAAIMIALGVGLSLLLNGRQGISLSDAFFVCSMVFFLTALMQIVRNIGFLNSAIFGSKALYRLFRNKLGPSTTVKDEYVDYVNSRRKFRDIPLLLIIGAVFLLLSILISLF